MGQALRSLFEAADVAVPAKDAERIALLQDLSRVIGR
jgi:hypothetical protein